LKQLPDAGYIGRGRGAGVLPSRVGGYFVTDRVPPIRLGRVPLSPLVAPWDDVRRAGQGIGVHRPRADNVASFRRVPKVK